MEGRCRKWWPARPLAELRGLSSLLSEPPRGDAARRAFIETMKGAARSRPRGHRLANSRDRRRPRSRDGLMVPGRRRRDPRGRNLGSWRPSVMAGPDAHSLQNAGRQDGAEVGPARAARDPVQARFPGVGRPHGVGARAGVSLAAGLLRAGRGLRDSDDRHHLSRLAAEGGHARRAGRPAGRRAVLRTRVHGGVPAGAGIGQVLPPRNRSSTTSGSSSTTPGR